MRGKRLLAIIVMFCLVGSVFTSSFAATNYDSKIKNAEEVRKAYNKKAENLQKEIEDMESDKEDTFKYIEKLDKKTEKLEKELETVGKQLKETKKELEKNQAELEKAKEEAGKQYDTMKRRIKYMYENGNQDYLDMIFGSKNMGDLLNRTEYVEKISDYDKNIFTEYKKTKDEIATKTDQTQKQMEQLEAYEADYKQEKDSIAQLKKNKKKELASYEKSLKNNQKKANEYSAQAAKAEAAVEALLQKKQAEIDAQNAEGSSNSGGDGTLRWPLNSGGRVSSQFGHRSSPTAGASSYHKGIDIAIASGTPIVAAGAGTVVTATYSSSAGNYIMISHGSRLYTVYMHCSRLAASEGDKVTKGQTIGYVGSTGISTGSHLHFGVSKNGSYVNPFSYVSKP